MTALSAVFWKTFCMVFLAELGDKTQLTTLAAAADKPDMKKWIFLGSALALVLSSLIAAYCGGLIAKIPHFEKIINVASGCVFIVFGVMTLWEAFK